MDCKRVREVIFLFFDNEMDDELLTPFQDHVSRCGHCAQDMVYTRKLLLVVRHLVDEFHASGPSDLPCILQTKGLHQLRLIDGRDREP